MTNKLTVDLCPGNPKNIYLHASAVNVSGKALLFLGHSTAGKSTISRLLSERYPVIADDKVRVSKNKNGVWLVCDGSDNSTLIKKNIRSTSNQKKYPLLAILRIFKSKTTELKSISPKETCKHLMDSVFEIDFQRKVENIMARKNWFKLMAEISRKIEGWHLTFKKDKSIIRLVYRDFE